MKVITECLRNRLALNSRRNYIDVVKLVHIKKVMDKIEKRLTSI